MTRHDFSVLTPEEFEAVCKAWREGEDAAEKSEWERTRILAAITIQPHVKGKVDARKMLPLPWDRKQVAQKREEKQLTSEERKERFTRLAQLLAKT